MNAFSFLLRNCNCLKYSKFRENIDIQSFNWNAVTAYEILHVSNKHVGDLQKRMYVLTKHMILTEELQPKSKHLFVRRSVSSWWYDKWNLPGKKVTNDESYVKT